MRIEVQLAESLVRSAVFAPYRQIGPIRTDRYVEWLKKRGIAVANWETLHYLWQIGILHPIAVRDVADDGSTIPILETVDESRLVLVGEASGCRFFADLGTEVVSDAPLCPTRRIPSKLRDSLLWHPFQLWYFDRLDLTLQFRYDWSLLLSGPEWQRKQHAELWQWRLADLRKFAEEGLVHSFLRVLSLLLEIEPLVHSWVFPRVTLDPADRDVYQYLEWRNSQPGHDALARTGLTIADVEEWHRKVASVATTRDPIERFRDLIRHVDRDERDRLKGDALRADTLYDTAEILRRYLEVYHWHLLPEETDLAWPKQSAHVNLERYGSTRPGNYRRNVFRRIARQFGVDPSYRTHLFLEGTTEIGYVRRWAKNYGIDLDQAGVRLVNLRGLGNVAVFEDQLRHLREEEVFALICVDFDHPARSVKQARQLTTLKQFEESGLLPVDFTVWMPNFVEANFTTGEVVAIATAEVVSRGLPCALTEAEVEHEMLCDGFGNKRKQPKTLEGAVDDLVYVRTGSHIVHKGAEWGRLLADWSAEHNAPPERANDQGIRPIESIIGMALRGRYSDYPLTVERWSEARSKKPSSLPSCNEAN